ncbi:hypothetical protein K0U83_06350 [bacterium]|nr:hypothetical protein [bacterium]
MTTYTITADTTFSTIGAVDNDTVILSGKEYTLTVDSSTPTLALLNVNNNGGKILIENTSTTTPIVVNLGGSTATAGNVNVLLLNSLSWCQLRTNTLKIQVGTGTGVAGQVVTLPTTDTSANLPPIRAAWVQHGDTLRDGTAVLRPYAQITDLDYTTAAGPEYFREFFKQDTTANTITFKTAVPLGAPIYIANAYFNLPAATPKTNFKRFSVANGANVDISNIVLTSEDDDNGWMWYGRASNLLGFDHVGLQMRGTMEAFGMRVLGPITNSVFTASRYSSGTRHNISASVGTRLTVTNCVGANRYGNYGDIFESPSGCYVEKFRAGTTEAGTTGATNTSVPDLEIRKGFDTKVLDCVFSGLWNGLELNSTNNTLVDSCVFQSQAVETASATNGTIYSIIDTDNTNLTIRNVQSLPTSVSGGSRHRYFYGGFGFPSNTTINGVVLYGNDDIERLLNGTSNDLRVNNVVIHDNAASPFALLYLGGTNVTASNIYLAYLPTAQTGNYRYPIGWKANQCATGRYTDIYDGVNSFMGNIDSQRRLFMQGALAGSPINKTDAYLTLDFTFDTTGSRITFPVKTGFQGHGQGRDWSVENAGDSAIINFDSVLHVTSIQEFIPMQINGTYWTEELRFRRPGGTWTAWCADTAACQTAFATLPAYTDHELEIELRLELTTGASRTWDGCFLKVGLTGDDYPFIEAELTGSVTGIVPGSRLQIYNATTSTELANSIVSTTSYSFTYEEGGDITTGDTIRIRLAEQSGTTAKGEFATAAIAGANGFSVLALQTDDLVYNAFGVDGSTLTQFTADYVNDEVDITVAADFNLSDLYAWWIYNLTTADGMREFFGGITAEDEGNILINSAVLSAFIDNTTATAIKQLDNRRIYRADGAYPVKMPTSGGGGVDVVWRNRILIASENQLLLEQTQLAATAAARSRTN